jgi:hypothetical protein
MIYKQKSFLTFLLVYIYNLQLGIGDYDRRSNVHKICLILRPGVPFSILRELLVVVVKAFIDSINLIIFIQHTRYCENEANSLLTTFHVPNITIESLVSSPVISIYIVGDYVKVNVLALADRYKDSILLIGTNDNADLLYNNVVKIK